MRIQTKSARQWAVLLLACAPGVAACGSPGPASPSAISTSPSPVAAEPVPAPPAPWRYGPGYILLEVSLSGLVFEVTADGPVPVAGAEVYCDPCGERGHTSTTTDADGAYQFRGNIAQGGGVWVDATRAVRLWVNKEGYIQRQPRLTIDGDTRYDIELMRR
jgi:hypothetical protein